jgi:hypothetical protein
VRARSFGVLCAAFAFAFAFGAGPARADDTSCSGPPACCPTADAPPPTGHHEVALGVTILGVYAVSEQAGTWDVSFRLLEQWDASPGFAPTTQIVNEVSRESERYDVTRLSGTRCTRSRRIHSTLHTPYNLRLFPFDEQRLLLRFADATHSPATLTYAKEPLRFYFSPWRAGGQSQWALEIGPYAHHSESAAGAADAELADFELVATRRPFFFITKMFVPLVLIVLLSFAVFWVAVEDFNTQSTIVITLWLAAIALQLATASSMPQVSYSTMADDVYTFASVVLSSVLLVCLYTSYRARNGQGAGAERLLTRCRWMFPMIFVVGLAAVIAIAVARRDAGV